MGISGLPPGIPGFGPPRGPSKPTPPPPEAKQGELYLPEDYNKLEIPKLNLGELRINLHIELYYSYKDLHII